MTTDLVNDKCVVTDGSMLYSLPRCCLVHTVDSCANEEWFSCDQVIKGVCIVHLKQCIKKQQDQLSDFPWLRPEFPHDFDTIGWTIGTEEGHLAYKKLEEHGRGKSAKLG